MLHLLYGTPEDLGVLISITGFAIMVLWALLGGLVSMLYRPAEGGTASMETIEGEVGAIEHRIEEEERAS
jgi:hypothetical protein